MTYASLNQSPRSRSRLISLSNFSTVQSNVFYALIFFWALQECAFPAYTAKDDSHFLFLLRRQLERNILESLKSICPFDLTLLLIMKYEIEVFPFLLSTVEIMNIFPLFNHIYGKPYISVGMLINLQNKVSVASGSLEFCEKGGGKL